MSAMLDAVHSPALPAEITELLSRAGAGWGVSTGYMESLRDDWDAMLPAAAAVSTAAVELSALSGPELAPLAIAVAQPGSLDAFDRVTVHAPSKGWAGGPRE